MMDARTITVLLLCAGRVAGGAAPTVSMTVKDGRVFGGGFDGLSLPNFDVESDVSDDLSVGASFSKKTLFAKLKLPGMQAKGDAKLDLANKALTGKMAFDQWGGTVTASLNSRPGSPDGSVLETVSFCKKGEGWRVEPTVRTVDFESDVEVEVFDDDTSATFSTTSTGKSNIKLRTTLLCPKVSFDDSKGFEVVAQQPAPFGSSVLATLTAPRDVSSKALKVTWSKDRVSATVDQSAKTMGLKLALPPKGWALELSSPWDSPGAASLKIGGKVDTGSLL